MKNIRILAIKFIINNNKINLKLKRLYFFVLISIIEFKVLKTIIWKLPKTFLK